MGCKIPRAIALMNTNCSIASTYLLKLLLLFIRISTENLSLSTTPESESYLFWDSREYQRGHSKFAGIRNNNVFDKIASFSTIPEFCDGHIEDMT